MVANAVDPAQEQHPEPEPGRQHDAGGSVAVAIPQPEHPEQRADRHRTDQRAGRGIEADEQPAGGTGEAELGDAVYRERLTAGDNQR